MDIEAWLRGLGLERYAPAFRDNEIDWEVLPKLTAEDLREIGVAAIGHRRKLLDAIAGLGVSMPTAAATKGVSDSAASADAERDHPVQLRAGDMAQRAGDAGQDPGRAYVGILVECLADGQAQAP